MYADRYSRRTKFDPGSMGLALALNGTIVIGLIAFAAPHFVKLPEKPLVLVPIALKPPPPPVETPPPPETRATKPPPPLAVDTFTPPIPTAVDNSPVFPPTPPTQPGAIDGIVGGTGDPAPIKLTPVVIGPELDTRFAGSFQPDYPVGERRAEHQGRVVVRVLIGADGRVKQIEKVSAASDAFFEATERRALQKWRFKPGTRDGVPIEAWKTIGVSFVLHDE